MQYILSEKEYKCLKDNANIGEAIDLTRLQEFCSKAACHIPATNGRPHGCLLVEDYYHYCCDDCPSQEFCPYDNKEVSK